MHLRMRRAQNRATPDAASRTITGMLSAAAMLAKPEASDGRGAHARMSLVAFFASP